jgi:hypothetical protein
MTDKELRELDAWIACNLFGWEPETRKMYAGSKNVAGYGRNKHLHPGHPERDFTPCTLMIPHYSTDPAAAMEVLKKCAEKWIVTVELGKDGSGQSYVWVARLNLGTEDNFKCAPTLELAICLFAKQLFGKI